MPSFLSEMVPWYLRITRANQPFISAEGAWNHIRERSLRPQSYGPPRLLRSDVTVSAARYEGWPIYTVTPRSRSTRGTVAAAPRGNVIYCHGGGWVNEIAQQHWALAADIAVGAGTTVTVPIYPLIPFGTADRVIPAFAELVRANTAEYGAVCLAGDSAGGQIALSTAALLRDQGHPSLPRTVLISPATDLSMSNPEIPVIQPSDPWLGKAGGLVLGEQWRGSLSIHDPRVSPLFADFTGLGPLTVFCGTRDILVADIRLMVEKARAAGVEVDYHEGEGLVHVYPLTPTPEGRAASRLIVATLRDALSQAESRR